MFIMIVMPWQMAHRFTFDETNWNIAQSVVLAKDDNRKRADQRKYTYINPSASSTDPYCAALSPDIRNYIFVDTDNRRQHQRSMNQDQEQQILSLLVLTQCRSIKLI